jgi:chromosome segregation ATPase
MKDRCDELEEVKNDQAKVIQSLAAQIETIHMSSVHNEPNVLEAECQAGLQSNAFDVEMDILQPTVWNDDEQARFDEFLAKYERIKDELSQTCSEWFPMLYEHYENMNTALSPTFEEFDSERQKELVLTKPYEKANQEIESYKKKLQKVQSDLEQVSFRVFELRYYVETH